MAFWGKPELGIGKTANGAVVHCPILTLSQGKTERHFIFSRPFTPGAPGAGRGFNREGRSAPWTWRRWSTSRLSVRMHTQPASKSFPIAMKPAYIIALSAVFVGCASPTIPPAPLGSLDPQTIGTHAPIALAPQDAARVDSTGAPGGRTYSSGRIFAAVFDAAPAPERPTIEIVSTKTDWSIVNLGFTAVYTYQVTAMLRAGCEKHLLVATGTEKQYGVLMPVHYAQRACENAAVELAKEAEAYLSSPTNPQHPPRS